jgi:hypothetical protein
MSRASPTTIAHLAMIATKMGSIVLRTGAD